MQNPCLILGQCRDLLGVGGALMQQRPPGGKRLHEPWGKAYALCFHFECEAPLEQPCGWLWGQNLYGFQFAAPQSDVLGSSKQLGIALRECAR